ncbi:MAG: hypothetical protein ACTII7_08760 [Galactobacter sp.]
MVITIKLTPDRERRLAKLAAQEGRTVNEVASDLLDEGIDDQDLSEYFQEWKEQGRPSRPASELWEELGL